MRHYVYLLCLCEHKRLQVFVTSYYAASMCVCIYINYSCNLYGLWTMQHLAAPCALCVSQPHPSIYEIMYRTLNEHLLLSLVCRPSPAYYTA